MGLHAGSPLLPPLHMRSPSVAWPWPLPGLVLLEKTQVDTGRDVVGAAGQTDEPLSGPALMSQQSPLRAVLPASPTPQLGPDCHLTLTDPHFLHLHCGSKHTSFPGWLETV